MRTTVTLNDATPAAIRKITGQKRLGAAIDALVEAELARQRRMRAIETLINTPGDHDWKKIKAARKGRRW